MPASSAQVGAGIGPPSALTQPNGLDVSSLDGATVTFLDARGVALAAPELPRMVLGGFTFAVNPRAPLSVTEAPILAMHSPPGGTPRYQLMGRGEALATASGSFVGPTALADLAAVRAMNGSRQPFSYDAIGAAAAWPRLEWQYQRRDMIDYTLRLAFETLAVAPNGLPTSTDSFTFSPAVQASGQASTPSPAPAGVATADYVVVAGDTLWQIAQTRYGDGTLYPVIARLNGIDDVRDLTVGSTIQVPSDAAAARALKVQQDASIAATGGL